MVATAWRLLRLDLVLLVFQVVRHGAESSAEAADKDKGTDGGKESEIQVEDVDSKNTYPLYLIDAPEVVCVDSNPPSPGETKIEIDLKSIMSEGDLQVPHVFTVFRKTSEEVKLTFKVTDAMGYTVVDTKSVDLQKFDEDDVLSKKEEEKAEEDAEAKVVAAMSESKERRLLFKKKMTARWSTGRKATGKQKDASAQALSASASYGYSSMAGLGMNFPGGYSKTGYGYSGPKAFSIGHLSLATAMLGAQAAQAEDDLWEGSRWKSEVHECGRQLKKETSWGMTCRECVHSYGENCMPKLPHDANRDDLMLSGFWPVDWTSPLTLTISKLSGADLHAEDVCRTVTHKKAGEKDVEKEDIYMTLTKMGEMKQVVLAHQIGEKLKEEKGSMLGLFIFLSLCFIAFMSCMFVLVIKIVRKLKSQQEGDEEDREGYAQCEQR